MFLDKRQARFLRKEIGHLTDCELIILFGPPGAGKGEICRLIKSITKNTENNMGVHVFGTSELARKYMEHDTELGEAFRKEKQASESGKLMSDEPINTAVAIEVKRMVKRGYTTFVVDGYCRTEPQAREIMHCGLPYIFHNITLDKEEGYRRMLKRAKEENRPDDNPQTYLYRYKKFERESLRSYRAFVRFNPKRVNQIDGRDSMRKKIVEVIKSFDLVGQERKNEMFSRLDNPNNEAYNLLAKLTPSMNQRIRELQFVH